MKLCNTCQQLQPTTAFSRSRSKPDGRQGRCRECWRLDYVANREQRKSVAARNARRSLSRHRAKIAAYLAEHPCVDCGEDDLRTLDFDHREPTEKAANVSLLVSIHASWARIEAEIAKCDVRCASCHRKRTAQQRSDWRHRIWQVTSEAERAAATARLLRIMGAPG